MISGYGQIKFLKSEHFEHSKFVYIHAFYLVSSPPPLDNVLQCFALNKINKDLELDL